MGVVFRQSIKTTIVIAFGALLGAASVFLSPFVLEKTELGFFTNIVYVGALLQIFMMMGTGSMLSIYIQKYPAGDERRKVLLSFAFLTTIATTLVFTIVYALLKDYIVSFYNIEDQAYVSKYYYWIPLLLLVWAITTILELYLVSQVKIALSAFAREVLLRLCNLALLALVYFKVLSFHYYIISSVLVYMVPALMLYIISARTRGFGFSTNWKLFSGTEYREIIHFSWYHLLVVVSINMLGYLDTLMLAPLDTSGMASSAVYSRAVFIVGLMMIPYRAMASASLPVLNQAYIDNDTPKLHDLFSRAGVNILIMAVAMFVLIACNLDNAVAIFPAGYEAIKPVVLILMLGKIIDMATGLNNELISISRHYKFNFRISALLVVMVVVFNKLLIPTYGLYGAAWGVTIALAIFNILKLVFLWMKTGLHPFTKGSIAVIVCGAVAGAIGYFLPYISNFVVDTIVRSTVIVLIYGAMLLWLKPSPDISAYFKSVVSNKRLF